MPTFDDVRSIATSLPEVEEKLTWETDVKRWEQGAFGR